MELPKGDFAVTTVRQFLFSVFALLQMEALERSANAELAGIAAKAVKETRYHVRHSAQWVVTLGDGSEESHARAQFALDDLWRYTGELFLADDVDRAAAAAGFGVDPSALAADVASSLAPHKRPRLACVASAIPLTKSGKVWRAGAVERYASSLRPFGSR